MHECKILWELKTDWVQFCKKILNDPILGKKGQNGPKIG